jgi:hypothetical protein
MPERRIRTIPWRDAATCEAVPQAANATHNNKRHAAMFKQPKYRQAGVILFATAVILILPNLTRLVS